MKGPNFPELWSIKMKDAVTNKIRLLKDIEPNPDWLKSQRSNLLLEISQSGKKTQRVWKLPVFSFIQPTFKPVLAFCLLLCLVFGGGFFVVQAAKDSLPGDLFYSVKITLENARIRVSSSESKPKLEAEFVNNRVEELSQIIEKIDDPIKKKEKIVKTVNKLQAQVASAKVHLDKIKIDNPEKAAEVTDAVNEKMAEAKKAFEDVSDAVAIILDNKKAVKETAGEVEAGKEELSEVDELIIWPTTVLPNEASESEEIIK